MESLYRKYRPQTFETVVGQKHIVGTLHNALAEGRVAHAYLFSGPRGTGKTTMARLLAKALLCEHGPTATPDGTCEQCEAIAAGTHPDVYELDAASRTGVDNVREEIINRVAFAPTLGRRKIYIIDEVHMLTTAAFNALLKTLEEPPGHVLFVMCTTDPQKVPDTILSRCQRLEFHRITAADIEGHLAYVCEQEGFNYDREALALIAKHARGGMRDALSLLEQLSVFGNGTVRMSEASSVLGEVSDEALASVMRQVGARDVAGCFAAVADLVERGVDITRFARDLTAHVRDMYVAAVAGPAAFNDRPDAVKLAEAARAYGGPDRLSYALDLLGRLQSELRSTTDQRLALEVTLARMARPSSDLTLESLAARLEDLERQVAQFKEYGLPAQAGHGQGVQPAPAPQRQSTPVDVAGNGALPMAPAVPASASSPSNAAEAVPQFAAPAGRPAPVAQKSEPAARPQRPEASGDNRAVDGQGAAGILDPGAQQRLWAKLVEGVLKTSVSVGALIRNMSGELRPDGTLAIENHGSAFAAQMVMKPNSLEVVQRVAAAVYGRQVRIELIGAPSSAAGSMRQGGPAATPSRSMPEPRREEPALPASGALGERPSYRSDADRSPVPAPPAKPSPDMPSARPSFSAPAPSDGAPLASLSGAARGAAAASSDPRMVPPWENASAQAAPNASNARQAPLQPPVPVRQPVSAAAIAAKAAAAAAAHDSREQARTGAGTADVQSNRTGRRLRAAQIAELAAAAAARVDEDEAAPARSVPQDDPDRVPDDVYDAYEEPDGVFGYAEDAGVGEPDAYSSRGAMDPPVPVQTAQSSGQSSDAAFELQQMLSNAFGSFVKVSEE